MRVRDLIAVLEQQNPDAEVQMIWDTIAWDLDENSVFVAWDGIVMIEDTDHCDGHEMYQPGGYYDRNVVQGQTKET